MEFLLGLTKSDRTFKLQMLETNFYRDKTGFQFCNSSRQFFRRPVRLDGGSEVQDIPRNIANAPERSGKHTGTPD